MNGKVLFVVQEDLDFVDLGLSVDDVGLFEDLELADQHFELFCGLG